MNAPGPRASREDPAAPPASDLPALARAALAACTGGAAAELFAGLGLPLCVSVAKAAEAEADAPLIRTAQALDLSDAELMTAALLLAADTDPEAAREVAEAQAPLGGSRLLVGLAARAFAGLGATPEGLAAGRAAEAGLFAPGEEAAALPERTLAMPLAVLAALRGAGAPPPGVSRLNPPGFAMPQPALDEAAARFAALAPGQGLVIRAPRAEGLRLAAHAAAERSLGLAEIAEGALPAGLTAWLLAARMLPVHAPHVAAGETWRVPAPPLHPGPWIVVTGPEGHVEADPPPDEWTPGTPDAAARAALWQAAGAEPDTAARAASSYRQGPARIAEVAARARAAAKGEAPGWTGIAAAAALGAEGLAPAARRVPGAPADDALILPASLKAAMAALVARARVRERLHEGLGPAASARPRAGMAALFTGESGTGKTLAASWFAAQLGLPLYRADLAALTSKWIGETEKNLDQLFESAGRADAVLFFDEADALFASRTDVSDAHDRHANAQTNYLLQRLEGFDGVTLLASNSRERFDPAFTRRLDAILEFPLPEAPARAALWRAHLGEAPGVSAKEIDRLAVAADLAGGHIRNAVFSAAAAALSEEREIRGADLWQGLRAEYVKLGRPPPAGPS